MNIYELRWWNLRTLKFKAPTHSEFSFLRKYSYQFMIHVREAFPIGADFYLIFTILMWKMSLHRKSFTTVAKKNKLYKPLFHTFCSEKLGRKWEESHFPFLSASKKSSKHLKGIWKSRLERGQKINELPQ